MCSDPANHQPFEGPGCLARQAIHASHGSVPKWCRAFGGSWVAGRLMEDAPDVMAHRMDG